VLAGLPDDAKEAARTAAEKAGVEGWRFSLQAPSYGPVMQYADNRELRARMYRAYATRAAEFNDGTSKPEWDNTPVMNRMLELRREDAQMLGYNNYAEVSLAPKMADSPAQVLAFLRELAAKAKPFAAKDIAELRAFAKDELGLEDFQPWDASYVSEETAAGALRLLRTGSEAILHRTQGHRRTVQGHREPVQRQGETGHGAGLA
jgi:oligopeptidase A